MKLKSIKEMLGVDTISRKDGIILVRSEFFYRMGKTAEDIVKRIQEKFSNAEIIDSGEHWAAFSGRASVANSSHWWVKFRL